MKDHFVHPKIQLSNYDLCVCRTEQLETLANLAEQLVIIYPIFILVFYTFDSSYMSNVDNLTLKSFFLIDQCPGPTSRCDHTSRSLSPELQRTSESPNFQ